MSLSVDASAVAFHFFPSLDGNRNPNNGDLINYNETVLIVDKNRKRTKRKKNETNKPFYRQTKHGTNKRQSNLLTLSNFLR